MADPIKGVSLGRDAWRRLRRNPGAMAGLVVASVVVLATVCAPLITRHDPELQRPWLRTLPPGASHPDVLPENRFVVGRAPATTTTLAGARTLELRARPQGLTRYRVELDGGLVQRITRGATSLETLALEAPELQLTMQLGADEEAPAAPGMTLRTGEPLPGSLAAHASRSGFTLSVREPRSLRYRVVVRQRRRRPAQVATIQQGNRFLQRLELGAQREILVEQASGETRPGPERALFVVGEAPPEHPAFAAEGSHVINLIARIPEHPVTHRIRLDDGVVRSIDSDGQAVPSLTLPGDAVVAAKADGRPARATHLLGTDTAGRDLYARILYGGRISLMVGVVATLVSLVIGVGYGALAGYLGGRPDRLMMQVVDILYGIPFMFLVILLLVNFGRNIIILFVALGAVQWLTMARIVRAQILGLKDSEFVAAARLAGCSHRQTLFRHLVPNCLGPVVVYTTLTVPIVILEESFLAFIGLNVEFGGRQWDSWGALVDAGARSMQEHPWLLIYPAGVMALTLLALNLLGDGLRDALDPRLRGRL
ncbi:MAG: ABC transporter permease subunit [Planctomycetota bacterium]